MQLVALFVGAPMPAGLMYEPDCDAKYVLLIQTSSGWAVGDMGLLTKNYDLSDFLG